MTAEKEKTKKILTALDITAIVNDLKEKILGLRVANIFDINTRTYVLKFAKNEKKECLIIESGLRLHTTSAKIEKSKIPSGFTMKFRKFLRAKKLEKINQIGCERVVDLQFGSDNAFHLILEFYSQGNIILTDKDYVILQLIRSHAFTETVKTALGEKYPFEYAAKLSLEKFDLSNETIKNCLQKHQEIEVQEIMNESEEKPKKKAKNQPKPQPQSNTRKYKDVLFQILPCLNPALTDHLLKTHGINPNTKCSIADLEQIKKVAEYSLKFLEDFAKKQHKGYLILSLASCQAENNENQEGKNEEKQEKEKNIANPLIEEKKNTLTFVDFAPVFFIQNHDKKIKIFDTFNDALDMYYSSMEIKSEKAEYEQKAWKKYENIKQDQENRLEVLKNEQGEFLFKANLIEKNIQDIEAIINIIKTMINSGLSWDKITKMINESKKSGDMLANMIYKTDWEENEVVILLSDPEHEDLSADLTPVQINFTISAFQNAKLYYENKKKNFVKEKKTIEASHQALKIAEKNALQEINKNKERTDVLNARKTYWFEKFYWFISSENYLVLSGRDGQQNEILVKKYMQKGDVYLHADYHGSASTIIKNPNRNEEISKITLEEAAVYAAARSKAWENKILPGTWWVYDHQVSKSAPSGEYLPSGSFMIRGKKNFINPPKLELGMGFLFKIDESCIEAHANDRKVKKLEGIMEEKEEGSKEIEVKEKEKEEYTIVTMSELQPRIKTFVKGSKTQKNNIKSEEIKTKNVKLEETSKVFVEIKEEIKKNVKIELENLPRGKKAKIKKMKEKYEEQDEDERQIKMKLIGASEMKINQKDKVIVQEVISDKKGKKNKKDKKISKKNKLEDFIPKNKQKSLIIDSQLQEMTNLNDKDVKIEKITENFSKSLEINQIEKTDEKIKETQLENKEIPSENAKEQKEIKEETKNPLAEDAIKEEENEDEIEEELERQRLKEEENNEKNPQNIINLEKIEWNCLVGNPLSEDTYFNMVPVCAPITALANYKHKIKLVPGNLKKGKAAKTIASLFLAQKDLNPVERKLIRSLTDFDLINDLIGNVKLVGSGVQKIRDKEKKSKKDKKSKQ